MINKFWIITVIIIGSFYIFCCNKTANTEIDHTVLRPTLKKYIKSDMKSFAGITHDDGDIFIAYDVLGEYIQKNKTISYLWVHCQEYYKDDGKLKEGAGVSFPMALHYRINGDTCIITDHETPRDGEIWPEDVRRIFPNEITSRIFERDFRRNLSDLAEKDAVKHFKMPIR